MGKRFSIPYIMRTNIVKELDTLINTNWETSIKGLDFNVIEQWKKQFM